MTTLVRSIYLDSELGVPTDLDPPERRLKTRTSMTAPHAISKPWPISVWYESSERKSGTACRIG